jgi:pSer/pThr/pTyr-binding forkhead associated (FHA) protein
VAFVLAVCCAGIGIYLSVAGYAEGNIEMKLPGDITLNKIGVGVVLIGASLAIVFWVLHTSDPADKPDAPARPSPAVKLRQSSTPLGRIRIVAGSLSGVEAQVSTVVTLGRDPKQADIVFPGEDTAVSRRHCEIRFDSSSLLFEVRDLGSQNGTYVADSDGTARRLAPNVIERLAPGHNILLGSARSRLVLE